MIMFVVTVTLLWYVRPASCRSYVYIWYGMLPVQVRRLYTCLKHMARAGTLFGMNPQGLVAEFRHQPKQA